MHRRLYGFSLFVTPFVALLGISVVGQATTTEGRTQGTFSVTPTGAATYTIPIWIPPGPRGVQPSISLAYNSTIGNGSVGVGWTISGLGAVARCKLTFAQDAAPAAVQLATSDGYCINGKRLRLVSGTYGTAGSTYQTEIADFTNVTMNGTAGNGPASFTVQIGNGLTYYYGYTDSNGNGANSQVLANGTSTASSWLLSKVTDPSGNNYVVNYSTATGVALPINIKWTPTSAGASSYSYTLTFNYGSNNNQTSIYKYVAGTQIINANLLSSISIAYSGTVVKDYFLGYTTSPSTGRYELQTVTECADSGQSNCLLATNVSYQSGTVGMSTTATTAITTATNVIARGDFNGDGFPDLLYSSGTAVYVAFGSATGYGSGVSTGISTTNIGPVGDLLAAGEDGIFGNNSGVWYYYTWNGSSFSSVSTGVNAGGSTTQTTLADTNGDGLPDLVVATIPTGGAALHMTIQLNTSSGSTLSFSSTVNDAYDYTCAPCTVTFYAPDGLSHGPLRTWDFDGDGRQDLIYLVMTTQGGPNTYQFQLNDLLANGTTFSDHVIGGIGGPTSSAQVLVGNANDDACNEIVLSYPSSGSSAGAVVFSPPCNGSSTTLTFLPSPILAIADWNGDGRSDFLVANGSTIGVYYSLGNGVGAISATSVPYTANCAYFTADVNGDGLDDLGCVNGGVSPNVTYYLHSGAGTPPDFLSKITDGYGNSVSPTYTSIIGSSSYYGPADTPSGPYKYLWAPLYVVNNVTYSDPSNLPKGTYNIAWSYTGAWTNIQGRGFAGFHSATSHDSRTLIYDTSFFEQGFPLTGMAYSRYHTQNDQVTNLWCDINAFAINTLASAAYEQRYFPYMYNSTHYVNEVGGPKNGDLISTTVTNYSYDGYGNQTSIAVATTDNDSTSPASPYNGDTWTTTTTNTPDVDTTHWCLHLFTETQVAYTATIGSSVTRTKTATPDTTNCRYTQTITEPTAYSGNYKVTETFGFDSFGNVNSDTVLGNHMPNSPASRLTSTNWGTTGQFKNTVTDPSGAVTTWTYTSNQALTFGVPDSKKDANNLTTSWTYDAFGRKNKETRPDMTSTTWAWSACASYCGWENSIYQVAQTAYQTNGTSVIRVDNSLYDALDRVTQTSGNSVTGSNTIVQSLYNSIGLLVQKSFPFLSGGTTYQQTTSYDLLQRPLTVSRPISSTNSTPQSTTYQYEGHTAIVTDALGHTKTTVNDVNGALRKTSDALGYTITRAFDAAGSLTGVTDSVGNTLRSGITYNYGLKPYLVASTDADRGAWTYTVDSLGERIGWTDAKSQSFSMTYDSLSRRLKRTEPDFFTQWTWGSTPANYNVGKLTAACTGTGTACTSSGYAASWTFDSVGRKSTYSVTEGGNPGNNTGGVFLYSWGYSPTTGLLSTLVYPISTSGVALALQYGYGYGLLQSVTDTTDSTATCGTTCTLWTANAANAFGEITQETLGNNVVVNRNYDVVTSWLTGATAGVGGGSGVLNQSYLQDKDGDVTQRQNNNLGLTESFYYDSDNRLTCSTLSGTCSSPTIAYDGGAAGPGNITSMSGVGTYTYPAPGHPQPHAVSSITGTVNGIANPSYSYDANGNMSARESSSANITWSSYNYPTQISGTDATGTETVSLAYGPNRKRWEQVYTGTGYSTESTYYIGGLIDEVLSGGVTNYRHYIYAGKEPIAIYSRTTTGSVSMSYFLEDHQSSVSVITSNVGAVDVNESFTPYGSRRSPTTWSGVPSTSDLNTIASLSRQGYTFQTALGQTLGLNHLNGRVQDAVIGRMLSADRKIPDRTSAQSYNRYSYVSNNPLTFVDPNGFDCPGEDPAACISTDIINGIDSFDTEAEAAEAAAGALAATATSNPSANSSTQGDSDSGADSGSEGDSDSGSQDDSQANDGDQPEQPMQEVIVTGTRVVPSFTNLVINPNTLVQPDFSIGSMTASTSNQITKALQPPPKPPCSQLGASTYAAGAGITGAIGALGGAILGAGMAVGNLGATLAEAAELGGNGLIVGLSAIGDIGGLALVGATTIGAAGLVTGVVAVGAFVYLYNAYQASNCKP